MRVLVACEFSGIVRDAFRAKGHYAISCDLLPTEKPGPHYQGDVLDLLEGGRMRHGVVGHSYLPIAWDLLIAHPPCTHLAVSGARWFKEKREEQEIALEFVRRLLNAPIPCIALENPISIISTRIRKPDQIIQPWMFGHPETKATCLWLKNLRKLVPTHAKDDLFALEEPNGRHPRVHREPPGPDRGKNRSRTLRGIADAMADQWGKS
jgi:hypothetical protein